MFPYKTILVTLLALLYPCLEHAQGTLLNFPKEATSSVGVIVRDLATGEDIVSHNAQQMLTPASITKSVTSCAALHLLGPDFRFETPVYLSGDVAGGTLRGDIIIVGTGDPTMESAHFPRNAGMADSIVSHLRRRGIREITGAVIVLDTMATAAQPEEWEASDTPWGYGAGIYGLNWRDNVFTLTPATGATSPHVPDLVPVYNQRISSSLARGVDSEHLLIRGPRAKSPSVVYTTTTPFPDKVAAYAVTDALRRAGITIGDKAQNYSAAFDTSSMPVLYRHRSPRLLDILASLMERSDNMFAEGTLRALNPRGDRYQCVDTEMAYYRSKGLDTEDAHLTDGSGLSRANHFSPDFLADILQKMASDTTYVGIFPRVGVNGTVKGLLKGTPLAGKLAFKSGSMNRVQCYAGYALNAQGRPTHAVVIMVNNFSCDRPRVKKAIEDLLLKTFTPIYNETTN